MVNLKKYPTKWLVKKVFGDNAKSCARVLMWHKKILNVGEKVEDDDSPGRHVTAKTEGKVQKWNEIVPKTDTLSWIW